MTEKLRIALERRYRELTDQLDGRYQAAEKEQAELEPESLDFADQFAEFEERKLRLRALELQSRIALPSGDVCPLCWLDGGRVSPIKPIDSRDEKFDLFGCGLCGTEIEISVPR